jgi:hypothetical protein
MHIARTDASILTALISCTRTNERHVQRRNDTTGPRGSRTLRIALRLIAVRLTLRVFLHVNIQLALALLDLR